MTAQARTYAGLSAEDRVDRRRAALMDAAVELIDASGWRDLTVDRVCRQAQLNKRYFYESFADLEGLAAAAIDSAATGLAAVCVAAAEDSLPVPARAAAVLRALVEYLTDDPRRGRLLFGELASAESTTRHQDEAMRRILEIVMAEGRRIHGEESSKSSIFPVAAAILIGGTGRVILDWLDGRIETDRDTLIADLTTVWLVTGEGAAAAARPPR